MQNVSNQYSVSRTFGLRIANLRFRIFGFNPRVSEFWFRISNLVFRILSRSTGCYKTAFVIWVLVFGIFKGGCSSDSTKPYDRLLVVTYAELTLLYEKEKMNNKVVDSLYQVKVNNFFRGKGLEQNEFKKQIEKLSEENEVWKIFIQDVTGAMDSLKSAIK